MHVPNTASRGLKQHQYAAKYPFHGQENGQLSFAAGHIIECEGESDDNWQFGTNIQVQFLAAPRGRAETA